MFTTRHARALLVLPVLLLGFGTSLRAGDAPAARLAQNGRETVAGVRNFTRADATIACGGALSPNAFASLKQAGFASVANLRTAAEPGVDIEAERKAAEEAGLKYFHIPFSNAAPDPTRLDEFLILSGVAANRPMLVACASGARASMFLVVKRVLKDGWPLDKATAELPELLGRLSRPLYDFALAYIRAHGKDRP